MSGYVKTVLQAFSRMDIEQLRILLKDYHYQDTTKEVFLKELGKVFLNLQHSGDTAITMYEGKCVGKKCLN